MVDAVCTVHAPGRAVGHMDGRNAPRNAFRPPPFGPRRRLRSRQGRKKSGPGESSGPLWGARPATRASTRIEMRRSMDQTGPCDESSIGASQQAQSQSGRDWTAGGTQNLWRCSNLRPSGMNRGRLSRKLSRCYNLAARRGACLRPRPFYSRSCRTYVC